MTSKMKPESKQIPPPPPDEKSKENDVTKSSKSATFAQLFSCADSQDIIYMILGCIGSAITGISLPVFNVLFGLMLDRLNGNPNGFIEAINWVVILFVIVACANIISGILQVACWTVAGTV